MTSKEKLKKLVDAFEKAKQKRSEAAKRRRAEMTEEKRMQQAESSRNSWHKRRSIETIADKEERLAVAKIKRDARTEEQKEKGLAARRLVGRLARAARKNTNNKEKQC